MTVNPDAIPPRPEEVIAAIDDIYHIDEITPAHFIVHMNGRDETLTCENGTVLGFEHWRYMPDNATVAEIRYDIRQVCSACTQPV